MAWFQRIFRDLSWRKNRWEPFPLSVHHYASEVLQKNVSGTAVFLWPNVWVLDKYSLDSILRIPSDWLDWIKMQKDHPLKAASCLQIDIICIHLVRKHVCRTGQVPILSFSDLSGYLFSLTTLFLPRPSLLWLWAYPPHNGLRQNPRQRTPDPVTTIPGSAA